MMKEHVALKSLLAHPGWSVLENEWMAQVVKIEESRNSAAKRGTESAWRYWAGQEYGFKLAMTAALRAIEAMQKQEGDAEPDPEYDNLMKEIRGEKTP